MVGGEGEACADGGSQRRGHCARDGERGKRQAEIDRQDKCYALWMAGQGKQGVMALAGKRRLSRNNVFEYYKRELKAIDVESAGEFCALLKRREKRLSRIKAES